MSDATIRVLLFSFWVDVVSFDRIFSPRSIHSSYKHTFIFWSFFLFHFAWLLFMYFYYLIEEMHHPHGVSERSYY